ncbi:hypothetical protein QZH41_013343, partial [Actinostola sp. cb2023]
IIFVHSRMEVKTFELVQDELEVLKAIFCGEGEFIIHSNVEDGLFVESETLDFTIDLEIKRSSSTNPEARKIKMVVSLPKEYPDVIPKISLSSTHFQNKEMAQFRDDLMAYAKTLSPGPMILDLSLWLQENAVHTLEEKEEKTPSDVINELVVLKLDHMRNRTRYLNTLSSWTQDLDIQTVVFFLHKLIVLVCEGLTENVREFIRRFKSCNIDVDCSGKPCKEKMMSFVVQMQRHFKIKSSGFSVKECESFFELEKIFKEMDLAEIYSKFVLPSL